MANWLLSKVEHDDEDVARAAKRTLLHDARPEAAELYARWLSEGAGQRDVREELAACRAVKAAQAAPSVAKILAASANYWEYRDALEFSHELDGKPAMPEKLLAAEKQIHTSGYGSGRNFDQAKVDEAIPIIIAADDSQNAAIIGLSLAMFRTKGVSEAIQRAGIQILRGLPNDAGKRLVTRVAQHNRLSDHDEVLKKILEAIDGGPTDE